MKSEFDAVLVLPYYGKYPIWINAFLRSCAFNPRLKWMVFSDIDEPLYQPDNVEFITLKRADLSNLIYQKTGIQHELQNPHKLCDFKPLYGHIFEEYLEEYNYWGHCDMDVIWGDLSSFLKKIAFDRYDIISTRPRVICGHFNLYRNVAKINQFYLQVPSYQKAFEKINYQGFDEGFYSYHLFKQVEFGAVDFKVFWDARNCLDPQELSRLPSGWRWQKGKVKNKWGKEGNYLHLIQWKKTLIVSDIVEPEKTQSFKITRLGLWKGEIPREFQRRMLWDHGFKQQYHFHKSRFIDFVKYKILGKKKPYEPNILPQYRTLD